MKIKIKALTDNKIYLDDRKSTIYQGTLEFNVDTYPFEATIFCKIESNKNLELCTIFDAATNSLVANIIRRYVLDHTSEILSLFHKTEKIVLPTYFFNEEIEII